MPQPSSARVEVLEARALLSVAAPEGYAHVDTFTVPSDGSTVSSNVTLQSTVSYFIKALGTYSITASRQADANWYQESGTLNWVKASDVRVSCGVADWDEYRETLPGQDVTAPEADSEYGGFITGGDAPLDASILDRYYPDNAGSLTIEVYAPEVTSVVYVPAATAAEQTSRGDLSSDNPDGSDGTPDFFGGWRIFPDSQDLNAANAGNDNNVGRNVVRVRGEIANGRAGMPVFFRSFDVDDPSQDLAIDPNGEGLDNRGRLDANNVHAPADSAAPGTGGYRGRLRQIGDAAFADEGEIVTATAFAEGGQIFAEVELATSFAPGDNFRVVASTDRVQVRDLSDQFDVPTVGDNIGDLTARVSPQLSVWRKVFFERDRMANRTPAPDNAPLGQQMTGQANGIAGRGATRTVITDLNITRAESFENGILVECHSVSRFPLVF